jgi:hypothetical protein
VGARLPYFTPARGVTAYRYLIGTGRLRHQLRFGALLLTRAQEARRLLAERREILEELEHAKRDYLEGRERTDGGWSMRDRAALAIAVCLTLLVATFVFGAGGLTQSILP